MSGQLDNVLNWVAGGRAPLPFWTSQKGVRLMSIYETISTIISVLRLVYDIVKLIKSHKKSRPDPDK